MSHVSKVKCVVKDLSALKKACNILGYTFVKGKQTYAWYGHWVGGYPLPEGYTVEDLGKCDHVIQIPGCSYEVGLKYNQKSKGYDLLYDFWYAGGLNKVLGEDAGPLIQRYTIEKSKKEALLKGYTTKETVMENGDVKLRVMMGE